MVILLGASLMRQILVGDAKSKAEFHDALRQWLDTTTEETIGDAEFGQTAWLHVRDGGATYRLNADTKRQGVADYLQLVDRFGDDLKWTIRPNRDGRENAVGYGPDCETVQRFYHYVIL